MLSQSGPLCDYLLYHTVTNVLSFLVSFRRMQFCARIPKHVTKMPLLIEFDQHCTVYETLIRITRYWTTVQRVKCFNCILEELVLLQAEKYDRSRLCV